MPSGRFCICGHHMDDHFNGTGVCRFRGNHIDNRMCQKFSGLKPYPLEEVDASVIPETFQHIITKIVITLSCEHQIKYTGVGFDSTNLWLGQPLTCEVCDKVRYIQNIKKLKQFESIGPTDR